MKRWRKQYVVCFDVVEDSWEPGTRGSKLKIVSDD